MKIRLRSSSLLLLALALIVTASCGQTGSGPDTPLPPRTPVAQEITFMAVGDMMISRGVARAIDASGDPALPFRPLNDVLKSTDFNFGNLECPISGNDNINGKGLIFNMHTKDIAGLL